MFLDCLRRVQSVRQCKHWYLVASHVIVYTEGDAHQKLGRNDERLSHLAFFRERPRLAREPTNHLVSHLVDVFAMESHQESKRSPIIGHADYSSKACGVMAQALASGLSTRR